MITIEKLDRLSDLEIVIFHKLVEEEKKYRLICSELEISEDVLGHIVNGMCRKLEVFPRKPQQMRIVWRYSVRLNKQALDLQKTNGLSTN